MRLSVDPRDATVRLTLPPRAALRPALAWADGKRGWIEGQLDRLPQPQPIVPRMQLNLDDQPVSIDWSATFPRRVVFGDGVLRVGGPQEALAARVLRFLRAHALETLGDETRALASARGITVGRVGVGDPRSRWGSCAASGDIRYSWRLILAPVFVRAATVAHEVAHRVEMNHGPAFHRLAAEFNGGDPSEARAWLRAHGPTLHWFGRDG